MTLIEHLQELRNRIIWVGASVTLAGIAGWFLFELIVELLVRPACPFLERTPTGCNLIFIGPLEGFTTRLKVAAYVGFAIAFPVVLFHFWRFVAPGLKSQEKRYVVPFVFFGMVLFALGVGIAYYSLPQALAFLIGPAITGEALQPLLTAKQFIGFMLLYLAAFGLAFEFPLVLMFLTLSRAVSSKQLAKVRRHVFIGIAVFVAFLTPSVDVYTMLVLTLALYLLYEGSIWLSRLLRR